MASTVTFFTNTDPININTLLTLTGSAQWIIQNPSPNSQSDRASGLGANGDEAAWKSHNPREQITVTYKCYAASGNLTLPKVGVVASTYHIDSVKLDYDPVGWPTLTVTVHKHTAASGTHAEDSCNTYATDLVFPAQFGVPVSISDTTTPAAVVMFALASTAVALKTLSFGLTCTHVDETGGAGDWLAGENHDGVETLDAEFTGVPDDEDLTISALWHKGSDGAPTSNTGASSRKMSLSRHIAREAA